MKRIILISCLTILAISLASCDGFLNRQPTSKYSNSSLWSSATDARVALNGIYNGWESGLNILYMDTATDNGYNQFPWEGYTALGNMQLLTPSNPGAERWDFTTIQRVNWFLKNIDKTPMDKNLKSRMKAQARFLRAYSFFIGSQLYGAYPLVLKKLTTEEANHVTRTSQDSVRTFVINELAEIAPHLPISYSGDNVGRITRGAALALKMRVELYQEKYKAAIKSAKAVMNLGTYQLFSDYAGMFRIQNEHHSGVILNVEYNKSDYTFGGIGRLPSSSYGGWASIVPTQSLVDAYLMENGKPIHATNSGFNPEHPYKNRDPRFYATIVYPGSKYNGKYFNPLDKNSPDYYAGGNNSKTGYLVKKYSAHLSDYENMWETGMNIMVIRYAEVLLSYAEAKIMLGQIDQSVYDAINKVRNRAGMPDVDQAMYNTKQEMIDLIRRERRVEFAMEGLRWYDIQRWKIGEKVMDGQVYGARFGHVDPETGELTLTSGRIKVESRAFDPSKNYLWPIPQSEMDVNDNLKQNPEY